MEPSNDVFDRLMEQLHERKRTMPEKSYTTQLLRGGISGMGEKIREEAGELIEAAELKTDESVIYEACDLIYHTWVLLASRGIQVDDLRRELHRREGTSGLEEKSSRTTPTD